MAKQTFDFLQVKSRGDKMEDVLISLVATAIVIVIIFVIAAGLVQGFNIGNKK
jgi:hypothetical protein